VAVSRANEWLESQIFIFHFTFCIAIMLRPGVSTRRGGVSKSTGLYSFFSHDVNSLELGAKTSTSIGPLEAAASSKTSPECLPFLDAVLLTFPGKPEIATAAAGGLKSLGIFHLLKVNLRLFQ
jgi:hypothetical protein